MDKGARKYLKGIALERNSIGIGIEALALETHTQVFLATQLFALFLCVNDSPTSLETPGTLHTRKTLRHTARESKGTPVYLSRHHHLPCYDSFALKQIS